jgi:hypothetical protein
MKINVDVKNQQVASEPTSLPQTPTYATLTKTSLSPNSGIGLSSIVAFPGPNRTMDGFFISEIGVAIAIIERMRSLRTGRTMVMMMELAVDSYVRGA